MTNEVVVDEFDHTCPWTGTAIGSKNIRAFHAFIYSVYGLLICDVVAAVHAAVPEISFTLALAFVLGCIVLGGAACTCFMRVMADEASLEGKGGYGAVESTARSEKENATALPGEP